MSAAHWHLVVNHAPVVGVPVVFLLLGAALLMHTREVAIVACSLGVLVAMSGGAAFLTGEPAEEELRRTQGIEQALVKEHEEAADVSVWLITALGSVSAVGLFLVLKRGLVSRKLLWGATALALMASVSLGYTANLGGQIQHKEIRPDNTSHG